MSDASGDQVPRAAVLAMAALAVVALIGAAVARLTGIGTTGVASGAVAIEERLLRFEDQADGSILAVSTSEDAPAAVIPPGGGGFVRGLLRGLARDRRRENMSIELPFRLTRWDDGRMTVDDPATGRSVDLGAFGTDNFAAFRQLFLATAPARLVAAKSAATTNLTQADD